MNLLVIDTETNGLFDFSKPADAEGQPRLAHLAMIAMIGDTPWMKETGVCVEPAKAESNRRSPS